MTHAPPIWQPSSPDSSQTALFRNHINATFHTSLSTYQELYHWSIDHRSDFWNAVWEYEDVIGTKQHGPAVDESATPRDNPEWFPGAELNWAENQLRHAHTHPDDVAIIQTSEPCASWSPEPKRVTQKELLQLVGSVQRSLDKAGVGKGDRVAWYGGNCLEAVVVLLATNAVGGVFSSAAADFGVDGVVERLEQVNRTPSHITRMALTARSAQSYYSLRTLWSTPARRGPSCPSCPSSSPPCPLRPLRP